jgi:uncharacterized protein
VEKFLPQRATIEAFGNGGFRFAGMSHQGSLFILPSGMRAWTVVELPVATEHDFAPALAERSEIDFLLIGSGASLAFPGPALRKYLSENGLNIEVMTTAAAINIYNVVLAEGRRVAAALIAVDKAHG